MVIVGGSEMVMVVVVGRGGVGRGRTEEREYGDTVDKERRRVVIIVCPVHHSLHQPLAF